MFGSFHIDSYYTNQSNSNSVIPFSRGVTMEWTGDLVVNPPLVNSSPVVQLIQYKQYNTIQNFCWRAKFCHGDNSSKFSSSAVECLLLNHSETNKMHSNIFFLSSHMCMHGLCIRHCQDSNSQSVPSQVRADSIRPLWPYWLTNTVLVWTRRNIQSMYTLPE